MNLRAGKMAAGLGALLLVGLYLVRSPTPTSVAVVAPPSASLTVSPTPAVPPSRAAHLTRSDLTSYAIATGELAGLPPAAAAGTLLDLWVSWQPPLVEPSEVGVQLLLRNVRLEKVAPPVTPDGPYVAVLSVTRRQVADLLNADRYGMLSVTLPR